MIVDTHSHLNFKAFEKDLDEVVKRTVAENIWTINVGTKYETSQKAIAVAEKYGEGFFAAIGLHPIYAAAEFVKMPMAKPSSILDKIGTKTDPDEGEFLIHPHTNLNDGLGTTTTKSEAASPVINNVSNSSGKIGVGVNEQSFDKEKYKELVYPHTNLNDGLGTTTTKSEAASPVINNVSNSSGKIGVGARSKKVVAIGEIGLDYYYKPKTTAKLQQFREKQKQVFLQQLDLAQDLNLPLILHCRMAHDDVIEILKSYIINHKSTRGVIHCFTGNLEQALKYIEMGFYIGINGIIFKFNIDDIIEKIPLEKIVVETDCPYLTPTPEGDKRNEPIFIKHTIQKIADLKGLKFQEVSDTTTENAKKLFSI